MTTFGRSVISADQIPSSTRFHQTQLTVTLPVAQTESMILTNIKDLFRGDVTYAKPSNVRSPKKGGSDQFDTKLSSLFSKNGHFDSKSQFVTKMAVSTQRLQFCLKNGSFGSKM